MKKLSRDEMKNVMGGVKKQMICACGNSMLTTACGYDSLGGGVQCAASSLNYCRDNGYSSITCVSGPGPSN